MTTCNHQWHPYQEPVQDDEFQQCSECQVIRTTRKADFNLEIASANHGRSYFENPDIGMIVDGRPQNAQYIRSHDKWLMKVVDGTAPFDRLLEIGAGIGMLIPYYIDKRFLIDLIEFDTWAADYLYDAYGGPYVNVFLRDFMAWPGPKCGKYLYDAIVSTHTLEHFQESDRAFEKMVSLLNPGGKLYIEVPDQTDLYVQDHWNHHSRSTLETWARNCGLEILCLDSVPAKVGNFLHLVARKPQ
jgi:SAM-dependent methyltransferase